MINRIVKFGPEARNELIKGADFVANAVKRTLGPFGANCAMEKGNRVTNDGVSIAREIYVKDEIQNRGASIIKEAAIKANDLAGDGTTTAIVLAQAILKEAVKNLPDGKVLLGTKTPAEVIRQVESEKTEILAKLVEMSQPIDSEQKMIDSALVSVEDKELAELIGKTQWQLGKDGVIMAEETTETKSSIEIVKGVQLDNGFGTSLTINNHEKQSFEESNIHVIYTNYTVSTLAPFAGTLDQLLKMGVRKLVIIARAFSSEAIQECQMNLKNGFLIAPMNAPYVDQSSVMKDLESVIGGRYIDHEESTLDSLQLSDFGFAGKIVANRFSAVITGVGDEKEEQRVSKRIEVLEKSYDGEPSVFLKNAYKARIAQLKNGFAKLKVGATSDTERKYRKDKVDDAVNAVRAALQEGVVPGAGLAFKTISESLPDTYILKKPLLAIYQQIMSSAPSDFKIPEWVVDPVKVLRVALQQACSVATVLASAEIAIATENPKTFQELLNKAGGDGESDVV